MYLFLKNCLLFLLIAFFVSFVPFVIYMHFLGMSFKDLPAPRISNSFTYNEKMAFLRTKNADILSLGSSATLNNLYSKEITDYFKSTSYLNTASWGLTIHDTYKLLQIYTKLSKPKSVIIASSVLDYTNTDKVIDYNDLEGYLKTSGYDKMYFRNLNLFYVLTQMAEKTRGTKESSHNTRETYIYDPYGGTIVKSDPVKIAMFKKDVGAEYDKSLLNLLRRDYKNIMDYNYRYLDSISILCKANNINLYIFQSPIREGLIPYEKQELINKFSLHRKTEAEIVLKNGGHVVDAFTRNWNDSLFVDGFHMNENGAKQFTQYCLDNCK